MRNVSESALPDLPTALDWMAAHWTVRELPLRIHSRGVEPASLLGAPAITRAFGIWLDARPDDTYETAPVVGECAHPAISPYAPTSSCPDCLGCGSTTITRSVTRYRYPMWRALDLVARRARDDPSPVVVIMTLVDHRLRVDETCRTLDIGAHVVLRNVRRLYGSYAEGPEPRRAWTSLSESQRVAETQGGRTW